MTAQTSTSDSLIGSLCREVHGIRQRCRMVLMAMSFCQNEGLWQRLQLELLQLDNRRRELLATALHWRQRRCLSDDLALEFLIEISSRPIVA